MVQNLNIILSILLQQAILHHPICQISKKSLHLISRDVPHNQLDRPAGEQCLNRQWHCRLRSLHIYYHVRWQFHFSWLGFRLVRLSLSVRYRIWLYEVQCLEARCTGRSHFCKASSLYLYPFQKRSNEQCWFRRRQHGDDLCPAAGRYCHELWWTNLVPRFRWDRGRERLQLQFPNCCQFEYRSRH